MTWRSWPAVILLPLAMYFEAKYVQDDPSSLWASFAYTIPAALLVGISVSLILWDARR